MSYEIKEKRGYKNVMPDRLVIVIRPEHLERWQRHYLIRRLGTTNIAVTTFWRGDSIEIEPRCVFRTYAKQELMHTRVIDNLEELNGILRHLQSAGYVQADECNAIMDNYLEITQPHDRPGPTYSLA